MKMVNIYSLLPSHCPALADLWIKSWQNTLPQIDFEQRRDWFLAYLPELKTKGFEIHGAFNQADALLGFVAINPQTHILDQIAVSIEAKGQNIAYELIETAKQLSPIKITLNVNIENPRAIRFYEKNGFKQTGENGINSLSSLEYIEMKWQATL